MVLVNDSTHQLFVSSCLVIGITILRLVHLLPDDLGAKGSIFLIIGALTVELFNYWVPNNVLITSEFGSILAVILGSTAAFIAYLAILDFVVYACIAGLVLAFLATGLSSGLDWINSWSPVPFTTASFVILMLAIWVLAYLFYVGGKRSIYLKLFFTTLLICFGCSLAIDVFIEMIAEDETSTLNVLTFDLKWGIALLVFTIIYIPAYYYSDKYCCETPCSRCSPFEELRMREAIAEARKRKRMKREYRYCRRVCCCIPMTPVQTKKQKTSSSSLTLQQALAKNPPSYSAAIETHSLIHPAVIPLPTPPPPSKRDTSSSSSSNSESSSSEDEGDTRLFSRLISYAP